MSDNKVWWYAQEGRQFGPHSATELKTLAASGHITATDMIWKQGLSNWVAGSSVKGLFGESNSAVPRAPENQQPSASPPPISEALTPSTRGGTVQKAFLWIAGVLLGLIAVGLMVGPGHENPSPNGQTANANDVGQQPLPLIRVGDTFRTPKFEIRIDSVEQLTSLGNDFTSAQPSEGATYVAIKWSYKNISQTPINAFNQPHIHLQDPNGAKYHSDLAATISFAMDTDSDAKAISDLNPGIRVNDAQVFEVSKEQFNTGTWLILVDADLNAQVSFHTAP